jgi:hypothetical protein
MSTKYVHLLTDKPTDHFPAFFNIFLRNKINLSLPDPVKGDTVLHVAFKQKNFDALMKMLENGGNPFLGNKKGETIEHYVQNSESEIRLKFDNTIRGLKEHPWKRKESLVHKAVRGNSLIGLSILKMIFASLESHNSEREKPIEIAIANENLEMSLFIMKNTKNVFEDVSLDKKCNDFLYNQITSNHVNPSLIQKYKTVWESFLTYRKDQGLNGIPECFAELEAIIAARWKNEEERITLK